MHDSCDSYSFRCETDDVMMMMMMMKIMFRYETDDGVSREERGGPGGQGVTGSWSYTGADGRQYQVRHRDPSCLSCLSCLSCPSCLIPLCSR